jgi:hypothetical protein
MMRVIGTLSLCILALFALRAPGAEQTVKYRVLGLFSPDREADLKDSAKELKDVKLLSVDYATAEAEFSYDPDTKDFKGRKPDQILKQIDEMLKRASSHTMGVKPLSTVPREKWQKIDIGVVGLDCKGCSLGAYWAVYDMDGVEQATASFKTGLVTVWIISEKTNRAALVEALKKKSVQIKEP